RAALRLGGGERRLEVHALPLRRGLVGADELREDGGRDRVGDERERRVAPAGHRGRRQEENDEGGRDQEFSHRFCCISEIAIPRIKKGPVSGAPSRRRATRTTRPRGRWSPAGPSPPRSLRTRPWRPRRGS